ncbi:HNH endonuclease, partial [Mycobacterium sp. ITM-2017-0098]
TFLVHQSALPAIDSEIAERAPAWGTLSDKKLEHAIDVWIDRHDPNAVRRTRTAMRGRYFAVGDRNDDACGTASVHGRLSVTDAALVHQRLAIMIANPCPDDPRTMDQRRADAVG